MEPTSPTFISLILAGVLGWATAYVLIHISQMILRVREPGAPRPFRSPLWPVPQLVGLALLAIAAYYLFPVPDIKEDAYRYYGYFLVAAIVLSFVLNAVFYRGGVADQFRRVPSTDIRRETEAVEGDPGAAAVRHDTT